MIAKELWDVVHKLGEGAKLADLSTAELDVLDRNGLIVMVYDGKTRHYELNDYGKKLVEYAREILG